MKKKIIDKKHLENKIPIKKKLRNKIFRKKKLKKKHSKKYYKKKIRKKNKIQIRLQKNRGADRRYNEHNSRKPKQKCAKNEITELLSYLSQVTFDFNSKFV